MCWQLDASREVHASLLEALRLHGDPLCGSLHELLGSGARGTRVLPAHVVQMPGDFMPHTGEGNLEP
jgi:hypothetical protein